MQNSLCSYHGLLPLIVTVIASILHRKLTSLSVKGFTLCPSLLLAVFPCSLLWPGLLVLFEGQEYLRVVGEQGSGAAALSESPGALPGSDAIREGRASTCKQATKSLNSSWEASSWITLPFCLSCARVESRKLPRRCFGEHLGCARMCQALWWDSDVVLLAPLRAAKHSFDPSIEGSRIRPLNRAGDCSVPPTPFGEVK